MHSDKIMASECWYMNKLVPATSKQISLVGGHERSSEAPFYWQCAGG
jgi:hypothetical protein